MKTTVRLSAVGSLITMTIAWGGFRQDQVTGQSKTDASGGKKDAWENIVGAWDATDRHVAIGSLYQPVHGVRKREATVFFQRDGERIIGHSLTPHHKAISFQERWKDGRTNFKTVRFSKDQLVFEFDIEEWRRDAGPISVEDRQQENTGFVRVEAKLKRDKLVGRWQMFTKDGTEVFRGEWEAVRSKDVDKKQ